MSRDKELIALINLIYEAALDNAIWSSALIKFADILGAGQITLVSIDWRAQIATAVAPRCDPDLLASWQDYWVFQDPTQVPASLRPESEIYTLGSIMPEEEFAATPVFNEFWRKAELSLAAAGANLVVEDQFSAMLHFCNAPNGPSLSARQIEIFGAVLRHFNRAVRVSRRLWELELKHVAATERLEILQQAVFLADASGRVVQANATAKAMLDAGKEIYLDKGRLAAAGSGILQKLIASCARTSVSLSGPGGEFNIPREHPNSPLFVTVTPLRSKTRLADVPWIGVGHPVAIVMVRDPDSDRGRRELNLRRRFGLTAAEARLATEILKGDGRAAAASRHGISTATARTHLSSIFEKTGTHRQAELVRLLLDTADEDTFET